MLKGRIWRLLLCFFFLYAVFLLCFFRSFNSDESTTTTIESLLVNVQAIGDNNPEPNNAQHPIVEPQAGQAEETQSNLKPVMNKDRLGNYEPTNVVKSSAPGEDGEGVQLNGEEEKKRGEESVAEYGFNEVASEKISLDRRARDTRCERKNIFIQEEPHDLFLSRPEECKYWNYPSVDKLPTASVVLVFYDEGWSTLVRTFHSVINTSPKELLKDIILVDDYSDQEHITVRLPEYIKKWNGLVKYVRTDKR